MIFKKQFVPVTEIMKIKNENSVYFFHTIKSNEILRGSHKSYTYSVFQNSIKDEIRFKFSWKFLY